MQENKILRGLGIVKNHSIQTPNLLSCRLTIYIKVMEHLTLPLTKTLGPHGKASSPELRLETQTEYG